MADGFGFHHDLRRLIGQTVTIFTTSGGASGCGFTGIVLACNECFVKLLTCPGGAPSYPLGGPAANCCGRTHCDTGKCGYGGYGGGYGGYGYGGYGYNVLGSVTLIPVDKIASFVQNAI